MSISNNMQSQPQTNKNYRYWRLRIMYSMMVGYAGFYLVRQNFTMALPFFQSELGYSKLQIGAVISIGGIVYGLGKVVSGVISDRSNARYLMSIGLLCTSIVSFFLGFSDSLTMILVLWTLNNVFQSAGWPPCARLLTHWFSAREIGTKWALWNTSQQFGGATVLILSGYLIEHYNWRYVFFVPAIMSVVICLFLINRLRDTPESLGLPSIEEHHGLDASSISQSDLSTKEILKAILKNKLVWYVCLANFFVYIVRMSIFSWGPTFLQEFKGSSIQVSGWQTAGYDIAGMFGGIIAGRLSDNYFKGHRGRVGAIFMVCLGLCCIFLWKSPAGATFLHALGMMMIGFFVTGPQILVGVAAADFASKKAAGAASGLTGTVGYLGTAFAGVGIGIIVDKFGWDAAFTVIVASAMISAFFFSLIWNYRSKTLEKINCETITNPE